MTYNKRVHRKKLNIYSDDYIYNMPLRCFFNTAQPYVLHSFKIWSTISSRLVRHTPAFQSRAHGASRPFVLGLAEELNEGAPRDQVGKYPVGYRAGAAR